MPPLPRCCCERPHRYWSTIVSVFTVIETVPSGARRLQSFSIYGEPASAKVVLGALELPMYQYLQ